MMSLFKAPYREFIVSIFVGIGLLYHYVFGDAIPFLMVAVIVGSIVPISGALNALRRKQITIEAFNFFALAVSFILGEITSAAFIVLMLAFASYLDWRTESRATNAVEELLKLKPRKAYRETGDHVEEIASEEVHSGDILVVKSGECIPVDGVVTYGSAFVNEASITGESKPLEKIVGDEVYSSTVSESGVLKIRATKVGSDSTIERMARLIEEAGKNKSKTEKLADKFAGMFLPIVVAAGMVTYFVTGDMSMTAALFLIVCADDIAVSIPLAVTASLGRAAKRGVIIKGGEWLHALARVNILVFDKTGTLTYGHFALSEAEIVPGVDKKHFWKAVAVAEKFSEHPIGRAVFKEATARDNDVPDPTKVEVISGAGVWALWDANEIVIGNEKILIAKGIHLSEELSLRYEKKKSQGGVTVLFVYIDGAFAGFLSVADTPRVEARESLEVLQKSGVRVIMLTGDNEEVAKRVSTDLGIREYRAGMTPETKLKEIERLAEEGSLAMVGDGINDAPALTRADVGIAMGAGGTAVAVEAANIVILTDQLDRIPEMIALSRRTVSVINADMWIWGMTNVLGIALVFFGLVGPALAAFYNFATDFLPLINSARLFRGKLKI